MARELGITQANASYHLRLLADVGQLQVSGTEKVRGGVAKKYRYVAATDIAGTAWTNKDRPCTPKGATAFGVRLLDRYVREYCEK